MFAFLNDLLPNNNWMTEMLTNSVCVFPFLNIDMYVCMRSRVPFLSTDYFFFVIHPNRLVYSVQAQMIGFYSKIENGFNFFVFKKEQKQNEKRITSKSS